MFRVYFHKIVCIPSFTGLLFSAINQQAKYKVGIAAMLQFYILQK
jgi:hypothetical protein